MCQCAVVTRRDFLRVAGAATLPLLAGCDNVPSFDLVSDESVEAMGLKAWEDIRSATPVTRDPDLRSALSRISGELLLAAGESPRDWEAVVFASPEVNAFALPGNKIGVFEGMFRVAGSADQLAAVVGHEIGHLQAEHGQERMNAQVAKDYGLRLIALLLRWSEVEYAADIAAALGLGVEYGLVLPYSRRQELEADRLGLTLMASAGFEPAEAAELWRRMDAATGSRLPDFLATHPAPQARIEAIEAMLPELRKS
jgi:predicted Zn-dependent protease